MKFGKRFNAEMEPRWVYIDYQGLKTRCKTRFNGSENENNESLVHDEIVEFARELNDEILGVEDFLNKEVTACKMELTSINESLDLVANWVRSKYPNLETHLSNAHTKLVQLGIRLAKLLKYIDLNVTAARKIVKKLDKHTGCVSGGLVFNGADGNTLERLSDPYILSQLVVEIQDSMDRVFMLRGKISRPDMSANDSNWVRMKPKTSSEVSSVSATEGTYLVSPRSQKPIKLEEKSENFEVYLARQLLVSSQIHENLAIAADLWFNRRWKEKGYHSVRQAKTMYSSRIHSLCLLLLFFVFVYQANQYSFPPFNLFFTEITLKPLYTGALSYATIFLCSWLCLYAFTNRYVDGSIRELFIVLCAALCASNALFALVCAPRGQVTQMDQNIFSIDASNPTGDLGFFVSYGLFGIAGLVVKVVPAFTCARKSVVWTRQSVRIAASFTLATYIARVFGRGLVTTAASISSTHPFFRIGGLAVNGLTLTPLVFAILWLLVFVIVAVSFWCTKKHDSKTVSDLVGVSKSVYRGTLAESTAVYNQSRHALSWTVGFAILGYSYFVNVLMEAVFALLAQMIFSVDWIWITISLAIGGALYLPSLFCGYASARIWGVKTCIVCCICGISLGAASLLPFGSFDVSYTVARLGIAAACMMVFAMALEGIVLSQLTYTLESSPVNAPLFGQYGVIGPVLAAETLRYAVSLSVYLFVALFLNTTMDDPVGFLNVLMSTCAVGGVLLLVLFVCHSSISS